MSKLLNIAAFLSQSTVNGPGTRFVLWLQGCPHHCPGCYNRAMQSYEKSNLFTISEIYSLINQQRKYIDGVTYSGGEPFDQAVGLFELTKKLQDVGLGAMSYTGYTAGGILNGMDPFKKRLLNELDLLIDGPFLEKVESNNRWRGSANQKCRILNASALPAAIDSENAMEIIINEEGDLALTGFFPKHIEIALRKKLGSI